MSEAPHVPFTETKAPESAERLHRGALREFSVVKHVILPVLGMAAIAVQVYYLCKPGQPDPYDWFPYAALAIVVLSIIYATWLVRRDPGIGNRVGSIVADE